MLPNFIIAGAAKAGTTALFYYLKQHPEIGFPNLKEPKYFSSNVQKFPHNGVGDSSVDEHVVRDFDAYKKLFKGFSNYKAVGEASPDYLYYHQYTAKHIYDTLGDIKIIITLRNPAKRAFSAYSYLKRDSRENLSFKAALEQEPYRMQQNWDFVWAYKEGGEYCRQVSTFLEQFSNVKIILQEDLSKNPEGMLKDIFEFLEVDSTMKIDTSVNNNQSGVATNPVAKFLLSRNNRVSTQLREVLKSAVPRNLLERVSSRFMKPLEMDDSQISLLVDYFKDDIENLEKLIKRDLSHWKK